MHELDQATPTQPEMILQNERVELWHGSCLDVMRNIPDSSIHSIVTDPPYGLGFMGKKWDGLPPGAEWAQECFRALKPGGHLLAFGGTRTWHRLAVAVEDAGFEIRDSIAWMYGSGFPKSLDVAKAIDRQAGADRKVVGPPPYKRGRATQSYTSTRRVSYDYQPQPLTASATPEARQWDGWATALKPAFEPIIFARKPIDGTVASNVLAYGTGALNIDASRVTSTTDGPEQGRWPTNVVLDESQVEVLGESSRFFYTPKARQSERPNVNGVSHPTVKPLALMRWLVRMVTPPNGVVLDPFAGSGTTIEACMNEGFRSVAIERERDYLPLIMERIQRQESMFNTA